MVAYTTTLLALASSLTLVSADYWVNTSNIDIGIKSTSQPSRPSERSQY